MSGADPRLTSGVDFVGVNVPCRATSCAKGIKAYFQLADHARSSTVAKASFVGGSDIIREMFLSGELKTLLADQGLIEA